MSFIIDLRQWRSAADFDAHLAAHDADIAPWARGVVLHHTYRPTLMQWQGMKSIDAMARYYEGLGWDRGPHLYIAVGSRRPVDDGIFQMTPLNLQGIHATTANRWAWGIEVVGNYDAATWSPQVFAMVKAVTLSLMKWRGIIVSRQTLIGHREVPSAKTCPGRMIDMDTIREVFAFAQRNP